MIVTESIIKKIAPSANKAFLKPMVAAMQTVLPEYEIDTALRLAHFLAQAAHETDGFKTMQEYASGAAYEGRKDLGNVKKGDGKRYKGRGIFQLTGRTNYRKIGEKLGLPLEQSPELAAEPGNAVMIAAQYWQDKGLNALADADKLVAITRKINGGLNGLTDRKAYLAKAKAAVGAPPVPLLSPESSEPAPAQETSVAAPNAQEEAIPAADTDPVITPQSDEALIKVLQTEMKAKNYYDAAIDGKWTENGMTQSAVLDVQANNNLPLDKAAIRLSDAKAAKKWVPPGRENAGITETRKADTPAGNTVRFWDRVQKWGAGLLAAIGFPLGGSALDQAEAGSTWWGRVKAIFEPFGGIWELFQNYLPWLVVAGLGGVIVIGQMRKRTAAEDHSEAKTS